MAKSLSTAGSTRKMDGEASDQRGVVFIESLLPIGVFLILLIAFFEICRVIYISLSYQFIVATTAREVPAAGQLNVGAGAVCCNARVNRLRQRANEFARGYMSTEPGNIIGFNAATNLDICAVLPGNNLDCNICDANGPGFTRNRILFIRAQTPFRFFLFPTSWTTVNLQRSSLAKIEGNVRDCRP